jgi:translation elongation factor EF-G
VHSGSIIPLVYTSAEKDLGVSELMDAIVALLPNPVETRTEALKQESTNTLYRRQVPGVEGGFAARVLHTSVDASGQLSVLRVISNAQVSLASACYLLHDA